MIKAIVFDNFGVLTTDMWREFLLSLPEDVDLEAVRNAHREYDRGSISQRECSTRIKAITGRTFTEAEDLLSSEVSKNIPLLEYISELKSRGYLLAIMSNVATNWIRDSFLTDNEQALFDEMIFSFEVGMIKPDPRIFMLARERLRIGPHEALLVDDKESYCQVAKTEGWKAVTYQSLKQLKVELEPILSQM